MILDQNYFRNLISGKDSSVSAKLIRLLLRVISVFYSLIIWLRNVGFNLGILRSYKIDATVISVGNITAGGTGKTPIVMWLCNLLAEKNIKIAIVSRGYKSKTGTLGDEAAMMVNNCPMAKITINNDRVSGANNAIEKYDVEAIVLDDAFQHRRIKRDMDIIAIDATCPFGFGRILPSGLLRESPSSLKRAQAVIITRTDQCDKDTLREIESKIKSYNPDILITHSTHKIVSAKKIKNETITIEDLKEKKVFAFCGIGNPESFSKSLTNAGLKVVGEKFFNDHHDYTKESLNDIGVLAKDAGADIILTTQKDWVKIALLARDVLNVECAYVAIELDITSAKQELIELIDDIIKKGGMPNV